MATYNFTTSGTNWSLVVDGSTKGPWPRHANGISSPLYKVDTTGTAIVLSVNAEPYYSTKIRSTDTVQINGVEKTGTLTEKEMAIETEAIAAESTGGGATEVTVYQLKTVLTDAQIKSLPTTSIEVVPAPGAGKVLVYHSALFVRKPMAAVYGNVTDGGFLSILIYDSGVDVGFNENVGGGSQQVSNLLIGNDDKTMIFEDKATAGLSQYPWNADAVNQPYVLYAYNGGGNYTGGHASNTLEVTVFYSIVDL